MAQKPCFWPIFGVKRVLSFLGLNFLSYLLKMLRILLWIRKKATLGVILRPLCYIHYYFNKMIFLRINIIRKYRGNLFKFLIFNFPVFPCGNINVPKIIKQVSQMTLIGRNIIEEYYQIRKITLFEQVQRIRISSKTMKFYMVKRPVFPCGNRHKNRI